MWRESSSKLARRVEMRMSCASSERRGLNGRFKCRTQGATFISTAAVSHIPKLYFERESSVPVCMSVPKGYATEPIIEVAL